MGDGLLAVEAGEVVDGPGGARVGPFGALALDSDQALVELDEQVDFVAPLVAPVPEGGGAVPLVMQKGGGGGSRLFLPPRRRLRDRPAGGVPGLSEVVRGPQAGWWG